VSDPDQPREECFVHVWDGKNYGNGYGDGFGYGEGCGYGHGNGKGGV